MIIRSEPPRGRLPRDRDLTDPQGTLDRIIREVNRPRARLRPRPLLSAAAAVAVIIGLVVAAVLIRPGGPGVVGNPPPPPSNTAVAPSRIGERIELTYVAVTLREARQNKDGLALAIETCLLTAPPTGADDKDPWYSWEAVSDRATYRIEPYRTFDERGSSSVPIFPGRADVRVGECVEGWLPFAGLGPADRQVTLSYRDNLGEAAHWTVR